MVERQCVRLSSLLPRQQKTRARDLRPVGQSECDGLCGAFQPFRVSKPFAVDRAVQKTQFQQNRGNVRCLENAETGLAQRPGPQQLDLLLKLMATLEEGKPIRLTDLSDDEKEKSKQFFFLFESNAFARYIPLRALNDSETALIREKLAATKKSWV